MKLLALSVALVGTFASGNVLAGELPVRMSNICVQGNGDVCTENFARIINAYDALKALKLPQTLSVYQGECELKGNSSLGRGANFALIIEKIGENYFVGIRMGSLFDYDGRKVEPTWVSKTPVEIRDSVYSFMNQPANQLLLGADFGYRPFEIETNVDHLWVRTSEDGASAIVLSYFGRGTLACELKNTFFN